MQEKDPQQLKNPQKLWLAKCVRFTCHAVSPWPELTEYIALLSTANKRATKPEHASYE